MTTLKDILFSRGAKACFAVLLAASLIPVSALPTAPAFAEDAESDATAFTAEVVDSPADDEAADEESEGAPLTERALFAAEEDGDDLGEGIEGAASEQDESAQDGAEGTPIEGSDEESFVEDGEEGTLAPIELKSLETTVEEPFSFWAPFRLLFGAASDGWTVPLKSTNHEKWIDRLDLSGAVDANGTNYALSFYNTLVEAADNDGTADWLIDWGNPINLTTKGQVGGVYKLATQSNTIGILATVIENNETTILPSGFTASEERVKQYLTETYGAFDRDYPTSFWRDITFATTFWRPANTTKSYGVFILYSTAPNSAMDIRAQGYRSPEEIRAGISAMKSNVAAIEALYKKDLGDKQDSDYERVKYYNRWLCEENQYNTKFSSVANNSSLLAAFQAANPDVWSARSALEGRKGETGPVCEGYARALKVLCDNAGIGCVLVDGYAPGAGAHMWNYVRMGSNWYGVDSTWNDSGAGASSSSYTEYLLKGNKPFTDTHPPTNQFVVGGTKFLNGPQLATDDYKPEGLSFAGAITGLGPFAYGDEFPLMYNSKTEGDVTYEVVSGPAVKNESTTVAEATKDGAATTLAITGIGPIQVKATLTPKDGSEALTDTITITAGPRPLKTSNTVLASKVYDGTVDATVVTQGSLVSARTEPSYASVGVLDADKADIGVSLKSGSAAFLNSNAANNQAAVVTYDLVSPTSNADKLKLYTLAGHETETTKGTISKRPVTAYFTLTSTRVLTSEALPTGTVRFEAATGDRGKLAGDDLQPAEPNIKMTGMPASMPTDIAAGTSRTYNVTWATPNTSVLTEIAKKPAAGNYQVSLSTDTAQNTVTLTIANEEKTQVITGENPSGGALYRVECRVDGINDETLEALKTSNYTSAESIIAKLLEKLNDQTEKSLTDDRVAVYDMTLYVTDENGTWVKADEDNFPSEGVQVSLDYPEGTKGNTHSFYAAHMFTHNVTSGGAEHVPGEIETPEVTNGPNGISFTLMGFSPVSVAWEDVPRNTQGAANQGGTSNGNGNGNGSTSQGGTSNGGVTTQAGQSTANQSASNVSQTGDSLPVVGITVVALACAVLIVALVVRRKRDDKKGSSEEE